MMKIDPPILAQAAKTFALELSALRPIGGMDGMALDYSKGNKNYVLKVIPMDEGKPDHVAEIEAKCRFINYLAENGVRVAKPIPSPSDNWVEIVETKSKSFLITTATKAEGKHINLNDPTQSTPKLHEAWGKITGQMHRLAKSYPFWRKSSENELSSSPILDWKDEHKSFKEWCQFEEVREKWIQLGFQIDSLPIEREGYGLIHNDLHPRNFLVTSSDEITVIDFDVCTYHFYVKDIAIALFFVNWLGKPGKQQMKDQYLTDFIRNYMRGYAKENNLDTFWFQKLPQFLKHHQILLFIVFSDEWKFPNKWQASTLRKWKREIQNNFPVLKIIL
jgi:Ser/Thr protein kinase RdoA (MazF antagonist)